MSGEQRGAPVDFRELSRAGAGVMTLLLAVLVAQTVLLSATGAMVEGEPLPLDELQAMPEVLFGMVLVSGTLTGVMAFLFAGRLLLRMLARGSRLGLRALIFGPFAAVAAGQSVGFLTGALQALPSETGSALSDSLGATGGMSYVLAAGAVAVAAPVGEELFFRGFLLESFNRSIGRGLALLFSATVFGLMHFDPIQSFSATAIGLVLGILALGSGSLWPAIFAHAVNNAFFFYLVRHAPSSVTEPEAQLGTLGNAVGFIVATGLTYGFLRLALGSIRLADLFESEPMTDF